MSTPFAGSIYITDAAGLPVNGALINTYEAGTLSRKAVYTTPALDVAHANPIVCANGRATFYLGAGAYRIRVTDADGVALPAYDQDHVSNESAFSASSTYPLGSIGFKLKERVSVIDYGAPLDGTTDATAAFTLAATAARVQDAPLLIPYGTYTIDGWVPPAGLVVVADGATLRRPASAAGNTTMIVLSSGGVTLKGLILDGNKSNNTLAANNLVITAGGNYTIENVTSHSAKRVSGGYGSGIVVSDTSDDTDGTQGQIRNCRVHSNDADGIFVDEVWNLGIFGNECTGNGGSGIAATNFDAPIEPQTQRALQITGNFCRGNTESGIVVSGTTTSSVLPVVADYPAINVIITDNHCEANNKYGIAGQGTGIGIHDNTCVSNGNDGGSRITYGGIVVSGYFSACTGNTVGGNEYYGIDAGGSYSTIVSNNIVQNNGNSTGGGTGINLGATVNVACRGNHVLNNGGQSGATGVQIYCPAHDSNGSTTGGLPYRASGVIIENNFCLLSASTQTGVFIDQGPSGVVLRNNVVQGGTDNLAFIVESADAFVSGNVRTASQGGMSISSATTLVIPDAIDHFIVNGTTTIADIRTYSQNSLYQKVAWVEVTNQGSGYTTVPTVAFSGGGGTGAAATAYIGDDGKVRGVIMTNRGSGYTSAPTVEFTGGGGSSAAATAVVGCANRIGRRLSFVFAGNAPITATNGTYLAGAATFTPGTSQTSTLALVGMYGTNWHETSRTIG